MIPIKSEKAELICGSLKTAVDLYKRGLISETTLRFMNVWAYEQIKDLISNNDHPQPPTP